MKKHDSLRAHLTAALPELGREPDALALYVTDGKIAARMGGTLSFEYRYSVQLVLLNFNGDPSQIFLPLLSWISVHQPELLLNHETGVDAIRFEVDVLDNQAVDVQIELPLTEVVNVVADGNGGHQMELRDEIPLPDLEGLTDPLALLRQIYAPGGADKQFLVGYPGG